MDELKHKYGAKLISLILDLVIDEGLRPQGCDQLIKLVEELQADLNKALNA